MHLLPGQHAIQFFPNDMFWTGDAITQKVDVQAGKSYRARAEFVRKEESFWEGLSNREHLGTWRVKIEQQ